MKTITFLFFLILLCSCPKKDDNCNTLIIIMNKSNTGIYYIEQFSYPDTTLGSFNPYFPDSHHLVNGNSDRATEHRADDCYEGALNYYGKLMLFVIDEKVITTEPWDTIRKKYLILRRYDLTLKDLQNANWRITYL